MGKGEKETKVILRFLTGRLRGGGSVFWDENALARNLFRVRTKKLCWRVLAVLVGEVELLPRQVCTFSPVLSSEIQATSTSYLLCIFPPVFHWNVTLKPSKSRTVYFLASNQFFPQAFSSHLRKHSYPTKLKLASSVRRIKSKKGRSDMLGTEILYCDSLVQKATAEL